jgi:hypothetical protein
LALVARKFLDEHANEPSANTAEALDRFATLYRFEDTICCKLPDECWRVRQNDARPRLDKQKTWIQAIISSLSAKTEVAKAMRYALGRWSALGRYLDDGGLENDNNTAKRSIYGIALGRKFVPGQRNARRLRRDDHHDRLTCSVRPPAHTTGQVPKSCWKRELRYK